MTAVLSGTKHRHTLVQMRTRAKNQLQHIAMNQGLQKKMQLWDQAGMEGIGMEFGRRVEEHFQRDAFSRFARDLTSPS